MPDFSTLTTCQRGVYDFIRDRVEGWGYGPTLPEIGWHFAIPSPDHLTRHLKALEDVGLIRRELYSARVVQLPDDVDVLGLVRENQQLRERVADQGQVIEAQEQKIAVLKDDAQVREEFVKDVLSQKRCPDCQRSRDEWYC
jgi:repressor LexA